MTSQTLFSAALVSDDPSPPQGLTAWNGAPDRRFGVYRNNVMVGLTAALQSRFPVVERLVGADFFAAMARAFIITHPPRSPLLLAYGDELPAFLEGFEPAASLPYLADVARLEIARSRAYHAADAAPLDPAALAAIPPASLASLRFHAHPSLTILRSSHPVVTIWAMNVREAEPTPIADWNGEDAAIVRPQMLVEVRRLPPGGAVFLQSLADGFPLGEAAARALQTSDAFDLSINLAGLLEAGLFTAIEAPEEQS
ncbi:DNA-binding domain-containing protein [Ciceribacter azotifigens]|uniref:HvfC/BufC N-terminal domain-containing protein n=1 Tax=Ciceribacter azotifigens TaxID=2069303 RepID=UPI003A8B2737